MVQIASLYHHEKSTKKIIFSSPYKRQINVNDLTSLYIYTIVVLYQYYFSHISKSTNFWYRKKSNCDDKNIK